VKIKRVIFVLLVFLVVLFTTISFAETTKWQEILDRGYIKIGVTNGFPPFGFKEKGELKGFDIDMGKVLAFELFGDHTKVEFVVEAPAARVPNLLNDRVDVVIQAMSITPGRAKQVWFTRPYFESWICMFVAKDSPYNTLEDLEGKNVAMMRNIYAERLIHMAVPSAEYMPTETIADSVFAVKAGRCDAAFVDEPTALFIKKQEPESFKIIPGLYAPQNFAFAVKPGSARWHMWLNTTIRELTKGQIFYDYYEPAYVKWFGVEPPNLFAKIDDIKNSKPKNIEVTIPDWLK